MENNQLHFDGIGNVTIPRNIKYVTQDCNGAWYGFGLMPIQSEDDYGFGLWDCAGDVVTGLPSDEVIFIGKGRKPSNWEEQLWEIYWV